MTFEASSPCRAPAYSPVSAAGSCNVEYTELGPEVKVPVLLMNREDLYVIVLALVVSKTGCTHAFTCYFANDSIPKRNPDETRQYISASSGVARVVPARKSDGSSKRPLTTDGCRICDALSLTGNIKDLLAARYEVMLDFEMQHAADGSRSDVSSVGQSDALPVVAKMEASEPATGALHSVDASGVDAVKTCKANGGVASCAFVLVPTRACSVPKWLAEAAGCLHRGTRTEPFKQEVQVYANTSGHMCVRSGAPISLTGDSNMFLQGSCVATAVMQRTVLRADVAMCWPQDDDEDVIILAVTFSSLKLLKDLGFRHESKLPYFQRRIAKASR